MRRGPSIIPRPETMEVRDGHFVIGADTGVSAPPDIADLVRETLAIAGSGNEIRLSLVNDVHLGTEGYRLRVAEDGVEVQAAALPGLRWAVQTLRQLAESNRLPYVEVVDRPRHGWRGSLLDVARWCHPLPFLYRYVDLLAFHKLNTLHLHLTDDQGWRFEVHRYPRLTEVGGFRDGSSVGHASEGRTDHVPHGGFYTQRELRDLVAYAAHRGVRIMPEVDAPGHMQAAIAAYPRLGNAPNETLPVRRQWGISQHVLNVADETVAFVRDVLDELTDVFPFEHVHIGGDEVPSDEWSVNSVARQRMSAENLTSPGQLSGWWSARLAAHLAEHGRRAAVWDELLEFGIPDGASVFAWQGVDRVDLAVRGGHQVVAAPYEYTYLDWAESDSPDEPLAIGGVLPLSKVYSYQPPESVLGVQGQLWSEYLPTPKLVEWRAFPRLAALAEVGWSRGERDPADFHRRLGEHLPRLDQLNVAYNPLGKASPPTRRL
ncbi:beta-N-acetylhexosaminidase [Streptomyces sp. NPDC094034]|uniref:beta-N-acetylhexosaminidase n=1 Tax=Streptomyces sp. NPDC094034 TaxID=3155309 RepID=UPI003318C975